ncbi:bifunctional phosphoribosyl-AMP cyclohydrolase/phosphoribosyl-ATP diphosphatase HisIE [Pyrinomonas methylaliphatogenes]|nr:bifunctional phosphoribosyl-AMP cyclohydrolase/phosphoribosyl-ATP diphosphatase HisIE [Pyrinomonas methylaliphatogenes]
MGTMKSTDELKYDAQGLIPAIVQDAETGEVLTLAYMNRESLRRTIESGETWFWSRSRNELWHKGATSGNTQRVAEIVADCDGDALLVRVHPTGPACHTGARSCFNASLSGAEAASEKAHRPNLGETLRKLYAVIESRRRERPAGSYTTYLFDEGLDKILKKIGEESAETIIAAKSGERTQVVLEVSDLVYHLLVMLAERGIPLDEIGAELDRRAAKRSNGEDRAKS